MGILNQKRAIIFGIINRYSLAYGIAKAMKKEGAELAIVYQHASFKQRIEKLVQEDFGAVFCESCDVRNDHEIEVLFIKLKKHWEHIDIVVHSIAHAPKEAFKGDYINSTTREGFRIAHEVSSYSFTALAKAARASMSFGGAFLTLTYLGANRVASHYNIMGLAKASLEANVRYMANSLGPEGIRVNAISAGPVRTLAASSIKDLNNTLDLHKKTAPLRQSTTLTQIGNVAVCLCSDWMSGVTGEIIHVDGGFHTIMPQCE